MKKDAYYFSHDCNARKDEKILTLLAEHGYEGYGLYWSLIEMMFENQDTAISRKLLKGIAYDLRVDITLLQRVVTTCYNTGLFQADKDKIWSNSLRRRKAEWEEKKKRRSAAGKLGMATRWGSDNNVTKRNNNVIAMPNAVITLDNKGKERKGKKVYIPPTIDEVKKFFTENGFSTDIAEKAFKYYEDGNWHDSEGKQVKAWKQKMRGVWFKDENRSAKSTTDTRVSEYEMALKRQNQKNVS
jgi:hypothetical protein